MGSALVCFHGVIDRDNAVLDSPIIVGTTLISTASVPEKKKQKGKNIVKNAPVFEAEIINSKASAPSHLPVPTLQALGTGSCHMPPGVVSEDALNYDSSYDSV